MLPSEVTRRAARRVKRIDRLASHVIRFGGALVILTVAAIFLFIGKEALPLFLPAQAAAKSHTQAPPEGLGSPPLALGMDEYSTFAYALSSTGAVHFWSLADWTLAETIPLKRLGPRQITTAYRAPSQDQLLIGTDDGHLLLAQIRFRPVYTEAGRTVEYRVSGEKLIQISEEASPVRRVAGRNDENGGTHFAVLTADGRLRVGKHEEGDDPRLEEVGGFPGGEAVGLAIDVDHRKLFAASPDGRLYHWYFDHSLETPFAVIEPETQFRQITAIEFLIGDTSLMLGYSDGSLEQWFGVRDAEETMFRPYRKIRSFDRLPGAVARIQPSGRDKGFLAASADGTIRLIFSTSARTLVELPGANPLTGLAYAPKLDGVLALDQSLRARHWEIHNPHPEISWRTLFGRVWYEGYDRPEFAWQSTGGTDDFEPKLSLTPLIFGTLKGAAYGLFFAIPLAVFAAMYTSQFMSVRLRSVVKPAVEIMAALPSVVIGFLAGLWLAPLLERHVVSLAAMVVCLPVLVLISVIGWHLMPLGLRRKLPPAVELGAITAVVLVSFALCVQLGPMLEARFFGGDLRQWIFESTGQPFEQRNSIVIGFAMGFAVIPIIFTLSEDALANVPEHFVSGSLALGANRWQTAIRIVLPTASPGIFSAIMVGFGRAVGETMIVLMATGNTPILSASPFNGMRTLSANIAVEIPEAPVGGTLYRILFLTAILLFFMTFLVNTVAEVVRQRLREKYKAV